LEVSVSDYERFIETKLVRTPSDGIDADVSSEHLFPFQRDLVRWALRRGRAAIFASTGLGKSRMQVTWAHHVNEHTRRPVLILAPLSVARQTADEGRKIGIAVKVCREQADVTHGVNVTNYDRLHLFDPSAFTGVVLDESSIIKHHTSKTLQALIDAFAMTAYRLCCTATPSPNDYMELGTHAEFLGVCTRAEMLAEYFVHDGGETQKWRLKGHARSVFWRFIASWGALVRTPEDLGYDGSSYVLPPLTVHHHTIAASEESVRDSGLLFAMPATSLMERRAARKGSIADRVHRCAEMVNANDDTWIVWCDLNDESAALSKLIRGAVEITGSMSSDDKEAAMARFLSGEARVLVSKSSICGFGMNMQHCHRMAFVGVTDSWEAYHQATKRIHRFGQRRACDVHVFASELEGAVVQNLARKERDAIAMAEELSREAAESVRESVLGSKRMTNGYEAKVRMNVPAWLASEAT
jgi:superfamily II DNA or RNA helicase